MLAATAVGLVVAPGLAGRTLAASGGCRLGATWHWHFVPPPPGQTVVTLDQFDDNPCHLLAGDARGTVWRSTDGGADWQPRYVSGVAVTKVFTEGMGAGRALVALSDGTVLTTSDSAGTFATSLGTPPGARVVAAVANTTAPNNLWIAVHQPKQPAGAPAPALYRSVDSGLSFTPVHTVGRYANGGIAPNFAPSILAYDPSKGGYLYAAANTGYHAATGTPADGITAQAERLWESPGSSGVTWSESDTATGRLYDVTLAPYADDRRYPRVYAATVKGLMHGDGRLGMLGLGGADVHSSFAIGIRAMPRHPDRAFVISDTHQLWYLSGLATGRPPKARRYPGLPPQCRAESLHRNARRTTFLVHCADLGWYRLPTGTSPPPPGGSGGGVPTPPPVTPPPAPDGLTRTPMVVLGTVRTPVANDAAQLAFDGESLVYGDASHRSVNPYAACGRQRLRWTSPTGAGQGLSRVAAACGEMFTFDRRRQVYYVATPNADEIWQVDPTTGARHRLFRYPCDTACRWAYDPVHDDFWLGSIYGRTLAFVDRTGHQHGFCSYRGNGQTYEPTDIAPKPDAAMGMVATGDGDVLVGWVDGTTLERLDRRCRPLALYSHPPAQAGPQHAIALACDGTSFPRPAVWLPTAPGLLTAFAIDSAACGTGTRLHVLPTRPVPSGQSRPVCARLTTLHGRPVATEPVWIAPAGQPAVVAVTSGLGVGCTTYLAPVVRQIAHALVTARFAGDGTRYGPSRATGEVSVLAAAGRPGRQVLSDAIAPAVATGIVAAAPGPGQPPSGPVQPAANPQPQPQGQSQAQSQGQSQSSAQGNAGLAAAREEQAEVARSWVGNSPDTDTAAGMALAASALVAGAIAVATRTRLTTTCAGRGRPAGRARD